MLFYCNQLGFYASEKKSPQELLSPQIIFIFIEDSPVDKLQSENFAFRLSHNSHKIGVQWGYKYHSHSPKALILSLFRQKYGFCRGRKINYYLQLTILEIHFVRQVSVRYPLD